MDGKVVLGNRHIQRWGVMTEYGVTVFDLLQDGELDKDHVISGNLDDHGDQRLINRTTGETIVVRVEAIQADVHSARAMILPKR